MRRFYSFLLFLALLTPPVFSLRQGPQQNCLVFTNVAVVDATGSPVMPDMTVVVFGDRITEVGRAREVIAPEGAQLIDGSGKFLIPGLWDMHVHILSEGRVELFFPLLVANGITGLRDMGGPPEELERLNQWRRQVAKGTLLGPRFVASGPILDGPEPKCMKPLRRNSTGGSGPARVS